jgi:hypothetical protein
MHRVAALLLSKARAADCAATRQAALAKRKEKVGLFFLTKEKVGLFFYFLGNKKKRSFLARNFSS